MSTQNNWNSFNALGVFLMKRIKGPTCHFTFWIYFLFAVIGFGAFGIWDVLYNIYSPDWALTSLISALYTYFPAIAMASAFDLILPNDQKYVRSFAIALAILSLVLAIFTVTLSCVPMRFLAGLAGCAVSLFLWWIANGENPNLRDTPAPDAALGGSTDEPPAGNTTGFQV